jgi:predicted alpha/beta-fold hydrolase
MPLIPSTAFEPPIYTFRSGHLQTIIPGVFRKISVAYQRQRIDTPDGDFLDIDWAVLPQKSNKLAIVLHGLEGSSDRHYVTGMIKALHGIGYDGLGVNFRSCSGEMNKLLRFYHHGDTPDLHGVVQHVIATKPQYDEIILIGFSMGGGLLLKYFGESGLYLPKIIRKGLAFSVPCEVSSCSNELAKPNKWFYTKNFLKSFEKKLIEKSKIYPEIDLKNFDKLLNLREFDNRYTAPLHGFKDAEDYYQKVSSIHYLNGVKRPFLLVNALDDPFLTPLCFPTKIAEQNDYFYLETPQFGGHVGFEMRNDVMSYAEKRALAWFAE